MKWIGQHIWDFISRFRANVYFYENIQLASSLADYAKTISFGTGRHMIVSEVDLTDAQRTTDHGVVKQLPGIKLPQHAVLKNATVTITELSNLGTYNVELGIGTDDGVAAGTAPSNYHELIGAGATNSGSVADIDADADIAMGSGTGNLKKTWFNHGETIGLVGGLGDGELSADHYVYICTAGTSNGSTDGTAGKVYVSIEYYGLD